MMMLDKNFMQFTDELASAAPVPGGGGAAAAVGALSGALASMVANLTTGKKKYEAYEEDIQRILEESRTIIHNFEKLADEDAESFAPVAKAYGLPKETAVQQAYKDRVLEEALYGACLTPLRIMEQTIRVIGILEELVTKGSRLAISDVGVGAVLAKAALKGASLNVFINTKLMKNRKQAEEYNEKAVSLVALGSSRADDIYDEVLKKL